MRRYGNTQPKTNQKIIPESLTRLAEANTFSGQVCEPACLQEENTAHPPTAESLHPTRLANSACDGWVLKPRLFARSVGI